MAAVAPAPAESAFMPVDTEESEDVVLVSGGRTVREKSFHRRLLLGGVGILGAVMVAGALLRQHSVQDAINEGGAIQEFVKPFNQCGGKSGYTGPTCCQSGCACIAQSPFYSQCAVPGGLKTCSPARAAEEVSLAKDRWAQSKPNAVAALKAYKGVLLEVKEAQKEEAQAKSVMLEKIQKGNTARAHKNAVVAVATKAKKAMEAAEKAYADKAKEWQGLKTAVHQVETVAETRKKRAKAGKPCPGMWGVCSGDQCCKEGCVCVQKNTFYFQCQVPKGKSTCDIAGEEADKRRKKEALKHLTEQKADLLEARGGARDKYAEEHKKAQAAIHEANLVGGVKSKAVQAHAAKVHKLKEARSRAAQARAAAVHAKAAIGLAARAVAAWKDAAKGTMCTKKGKKAEPEKEEGTHGEPAAEEDGEGDMSEDEEMEEEEGVTTV